MKINVEFDHYNEMLDFCRNIVGGSGKVVITPESIEFNAGGGAVAEKANPLPDAPVTAESAQPAPQSVSEIMNAPEPTPIQPNFPTVPEPVQQAVPEPVQPPKAIDLDMISRAGATLIDQGKMADILALLKKYGVMAVNKLDPSQFPAFAEDLRALGASI